MLPLIPFFPLAGFLFNATLGRRLSKNVSGLVATGAMGLSFGVSVAATTATRIAGTRGTRLRIRIIASAPPPIARLAGLISPPSTLRAMAAIRRSGPSASIEKPSSFGN